MKKSHEASVLEAGERLVLDVEDIAAFREKFWGLDDLRELRETLQFTEVIPADHILENS